MQLQGPVRQVHALQRVEGSNPWLTFLVNQQPASSPLPQASPPTRVCKLQVCDVPVVEAAREAGVLLVVLGDQPKVLLPQRVQAGAWAGAGGGAAENHSP